MWEAAFDGQKNQVLNFMTSLYSNCAKLKPLPDGLNCPRPLPGPKNWRRNRTRTQGRHGPTGAYEPKRSHGAPMGPWGHGPIGPAARGRPAGGRHFFYGGKSHLNGHCHMIMNWQGETFWLLNELASQGHVNTMATGGGGHRPRPRVPSIAFEYTWYNLADLVPDFFGPQTPGTS